jgi:outer membrane lipoprotein-sorting protein
VVGLVIGLGLLSPLAADEAAWAELERARQELAAAPLAAEFVQTYVPAGFSSGDEENGRVYLSLPSCLRWDYEEPYPRSYLLCAQTVWAWSPEEPVGDRYLAVSREEAGLDFLLLSVDRLRLRYAASLGTADGTSGDEAIAIDLASLTDEAPFARARITLDGASRRPVRLEYTDREGNSTRFDLTSFAALADHGLFLPPEEIEWIDG